LEGIALPALQHLKDHPLAILFTSFSQGIKCSTDDYQKHYFFREKEASLFHAACFHGTGHHSIECPGAV
jgi:hypothetical protein